VPIVPRGLVTQNEIRAGVERAQVALTPDVIRIRYSIAPDWTGEESLFFRVLLSDHAAKENQSRATTQRITLEILNAVKAEDLGLQTYFNFRTESEQRQLKEATWE
jgi:hypothetical protein